MNASSKSSSQSFPIARTVRRTRRWLSSVSSMWLLTLVCTLLAIGLVLIHFSRRAKRS